MSERENGSLGLSLYLLVLLTALHTLSLTDRFLIAAFGTQISLDLGLSNQQFGLVTGLAFTLFYAQHRACGRAAGRSVWAGSFAGDRSAHMERYDRPHGHGKKLFRTVAAPYLSGGW